MDPAGAADPEVPPNPLTHLSLRDRSEMQLQSEADRRSLPGTWTRSSPEHATILRGGVRRCLQQQCEQTVRILHAKVAQKSYGNEKRFFCPPPCVYLSGPGWRVKSGQGQAHQAGESGPTVCGYMGLDSASGSAAETQKLNFEQQPDSREFGCAKTLYVSDADKRKHFRLVLRLVLRGGLELGTFHSRLIKVISKPSQKKQSLKNTDLCISSGSKVSLFNRLRSQTVSTRYLSVQDGAFVASARQWAAFTLHLADGHSSQGDFPRREGYVRYGSLVQLVCTVTGITLPPMIIRKVAKQCALLDVDEPISQLHKCAFQFPGSPPGGGGTYLCLATEKVVQFQLLLDHHRHRGGGILLQHQPGVYAGAGHAGAPHQHPRAERRRRCGHAGAPRRELPRGAQGVVWGRGSRNHVQEPAVPGVRGAGRGGLR
nr:recombining binding protein suppressor of hairless-like protein isoform X2 [Saimiri boliviensis boliviensis]